eukprot:jgi/Botrbrau1/16904/Bobra.55_3s0005.1
MEASTSAASPVSGASESTPSSGNPSADGPEPALTSAGVGQGNHSRCIFGWLLCTPEQHTPTREKMPAGTTVEHPRKYRYVLLCTSTTME